MNRRRSCGLLGFHLAGKKTLYDVFQKATLKHNEDPCDAPAIKSGVTLPVFDERIDVLSNFCKSAKKVLLDVELFHWNMKITERDDFCPKFLEEMRTTSVLLHVVRCYGSTPPSPSDEIEKMNAKVIECDLELLRKRLTRVMSAKKNQTGDVEALEKMADWLENGKSARLLPADDALRSNLKISELQLLSMKPMIYVINLDETLLGNAENPPLSEIKSSFAEELIEPAPVFSCCAQTENELTTLAPAEKQSFMQAYGIDSPCHEKISKLAYRSMPLQTFFTTGDTMTHAWSVSKGSTALEASGQIHSKFKKDFRSAKVLPWDKYITHGSIQAAEAAMDLKTKDYVMNDGDVMIVNLDKSAKE